MSSASFVDKAAVEWMTFMRVSCADCKRVASDAEKESRNKWRYVPVLFDWPEASMLPPSTFAGPAACPTVSCNCD